jgi:GDPmannose 4,6-dehydratase
MLQKKKPEDYIIATGKNYSVKEFIKKSLKILDIKVKWKGSGINTKVFTLDGRCIIECKKKYFRPTEVDTLLGNPAKAKKNLKWQPKISFDNLIKEMIDEDLKSLKKNAKKK